jgi:hypothetical protein
MCSVIIERLNLPLIITEAQVLNPSLGRATGGAPAAFA